MRLRLGLALDAGTGCGLGARPRPVTEHDRPAKADTADPAIEYGIADIETPDLPKGAFELIYSALTFHYVEDFGRLIRAIHEALVPGGDLVFTIEAPPPPST